MYRKQPVFALLGGISSRTWGPIHEFCEKNRIPCILPITDLPEISESGWYTLYFSKGYYQEGEAAAKYLAQVLDLPADKQIVQVFRGDDKGRALSQGFTDVWKELGKAALKNRIVSAGEKTGRSFWKGLSTAYPNAVMVIWLGPEDVSGLGSLAKLRERPSAIFLSSKMLDGKLSAVPDSTRDFTFITYPERLPDDRQQVSVRVNRWLEAKGIPSPNMAISSKAYYLTRLLGTALVNMRDNFYRDYFLDIFDVLEDRTANIGLYPRLSFGPGQRYASKGCYVVKLTKGPQPKIIRQSDWIIY